MAQTTGVAPLTLAGDKTTTCWMLYELIIANIVGDQLGLGVYEEQFKAKSPASGRCCPEGTGA